MQTDTALAQTEKFLKESLRENNVGITLDPSGGASSEKSERNGGG